MTTTKLNASKPIFTSALGKLMLTGAGIALLIIAFFVIGAGKGNPTWDAYWRIKPLLLTPIIGALVGLCYDITQALREIKGWVGKLFTVLSLFGYLIGLWMGTVLGLAGTMWN